MNDTQLEELMRRERIAEAEYLENRCLPLFQHYIKCLKGEAEDLTGLGAFRIFQNSINKNRIEEVRKKVRDVYLKEIGMLLY